MRSLIPMIPMKKMIMMTKLNRLEYSILGDLLNTAFSIIQHDHGKDGLQNVILALKHLEEVNVESGQPDLSQIDSSIL